MLTAHLVKLIDAAATCRWGEEGAGREGGEGGREGREGGRKREKVILDHGRGEKETRKMEEGGRKRSSYQIVGFFYDNFCKLLVKSHRINHKHFFADNRSTKFVKY